jgi:hypothetical protein
MDFYFTPNIFVASRLFVYIQPKAAKLARCYFLAWGNREAGHSSTYFEAGGRRKNNNTNNFVTFCRRKKSLFYDSKCRFRQMKSIF